MYDLPVLLQPLSPPPPSPSILQKCVSPSTDVIISVLSCLFPDASSFKINFDLLTLFIPGFFGWCGNGGGGGGFHLHPVTPMSLKSYDSNSVQNYFGGKINTLRQEKSGSS